MFEIIDKYSIRKDIAEEYFEQMLHCYMHFEPDVKFEEFFSVITTIVITLFDFKSIREMNLYISIYRKMVEVNQMITELYNKLVLKNDKPESKPRKVSLRQYFVWCYVKESIYRDMTPFKLERGTIDEVANSAAQITFKLLTDKQKEDIKKAYEAMTDEQLEHLKNL